MTIRKVAAITAASLLPVFIIFIAIILSEDLSFNKLLGYSVATALVLFVFVYFVGLYFIEKFIYGKIKIIYKTIQNLKIKNYLPENLKTDSDLLSKVNHDVENWVKKSSEELENLRSLEEYRKEFLGNVAHELKTPIFNIQGYILTLLEGGLEDEKINRDYLMRAERSVERMIDIIEDLDTVTRLESGRLSIEPVRFDIVELIKEVYHAQEMNARNRQISLKTDKRMDRPVFVLADKERIRQVLTNLIVNSIKYGKESGTTETRLYDMEDSLLVEISDNGIGIEKEHLPRLFERFYRVDKSRSRDSGGSGLGLSIVKHIIEAHNQTINVRSTPGVGSTFFFTLKLVK
jgi:two-component system, OmpR family, phosphate regulon sensor histidine kinase PhoR